MAKRVHLSSEALAESARAALVDDSRVHVELTSGQRAAVLKAYPDQVTEVTVPSTGHARYTSPRLRLRRADNGEIAGNVKLTEQPTANGAPFVSVNDRPGSGMPPVTEPTLESDDLEASEVPAAWSAAHSRDAE